MGSRKILTGWITFPCFTTRTYYTTDVRNPIHRFHFRVAYAVVWNGMRGAAADGLHCGTAVGCLRFSAADGCLGMGHVGNCSDAARSIASKGAVLEVLREAERQGPSCG